jgi:hypothetical protein
MERTPTMNSSKSVNSRRRRRRSTSVSNKKSINDIRNFDAFGITTDLDELDKKVASVMIQDMRFNTGSNSVNNNNDIYNNLFHAQNDDEDGASSCVSIESRESLDEKEQKQFHFTNIVQMHNDRHESTSFRRREMGTRDRDNRRLSTQEKLRRSSKTKKASIRRRQAEIENVILKQILESRRYHDEEDDEEDDDGHVSVATGIMSVMSTYTTKDILGDLTDHEDVKSVRRGRRSQSRSRTRSRSTTRARTRSSSTKPRGHESVSNSSSSKVRSKSVVYRRVRLKDAKDTDEQSTIEGVEESKKLYDSFMKNLSPEMFSTKNREKSVKQSTTRRKQMNSLWDLDQFETFSGFDDSFVQKTSFFQSSDQYSRKGKNQVSKPTLKRLSSAPVSNHVATTRKALNEPLSKSSLIRQSSAPQDLSPFQPKSKINKLRTQRTILESSENGSMFRNTFNRNTFNESFFQNQPTKSDDMASSVITATTAMTENTVARSNKSEKTKNIVTQNNRSPTPVYTFEDTSVTTNKRRPKQFMEERIITQLSPVRQKKVPQWNETTSPHSFVPKMEPISNTPNKNVVHSSEGWNAFKSNKHEILPVSESSLVPIAEKNEIWTSFTGKATVTAATSVSDNHTQPSSKQKDNSYKQSKHGFESFPNPSWGNDDFPDENDNVNTAPFNFKPSSDVDESTDSSGFKVLKNSTKFNSSIESNEPFDIDESTDSSGFRILRKSTSFHTSDNSTERFTNDNTHEPARFGSLMPVAVNSWGDFDESQGLSDGNWDTKDFSDPFVADVSASTISYVDSPHITSSKYSGKSDNSNITSTTVSTCRSSPNNSYESMSSSRFRSSPTFLRGSPKDTSSQLSGSQLSGSQLSGSQLSGSQLSGSQLSGSQLSGSQLSGSQLSGSQPLGWTDLSPNNVADFNSSSRKRLFIHHRG